MALRGLRRVLRSAERASWRARSLRLRLDFKQQFFIMPRAMWLGYAEWRPCWRPPGMASGASCGAVACKRCVASSALLVVVPFRPSIASPAGSLSAAPFRRWIGLNGCVNYVRATQNNFVSTSIGATGLGSLQSRIQPE